MSEITLNTLEDGLYATAQLTPGALAALARGGIRSIINNRPDFEGGPEQATSDQMQHAAEAAGLAYRYLPVNGAHQTPEEAAAFARLITELPRPIVAYCRSGTRVSRLYQLGREQDS